MTTYRLCLSLGAALCAACLLSGCVAVITTGNGAPQDTTKFTVENTDRFLALDAATEAAISCTGLQERSLPDGRLEVVANLRNSSAGAVRVHVQCVFLDEQSLPLRAESPWQRLSISNGTTEVVRFTAPSADAKKYSIRVRADR
jgi:uncharacterized protein YcfL